MKKLMLTFSMLLATTTAVNAADDYTLEIYERSCKNCHENTATTAPQTGDAEAWKPRMEKGMDALLTSTIEGFESMPPLGMCMDCEGEDFIALIEYMAEGK